MASAAISRAELPRYDLNLKLDTATHQANFTQKITWKNTSKTAANELILNFYPHYRIPEGDFLLLAKTLEMMRLNPRDGIDRYGRAGTIHTVTQNGQLLEYEYQHDNPTAFVIKLSKPVAPQESVTITLDATINLPNKQGRWGYWEGIHCLANALPVVAYHDDRGWHAMPFVPWHQPFWNEAGHYTASITLPKEEKLACSAGLQSEVMNADGTRTVTTVPFTGRDFAIVCSPLYQETLKTITLKTGKTVTLKCLAYDKHKYYSEKILEYIAEAIPVYSDWFGEFPYEQFTVAESWFGWNGNECSGLILIDARIFGSPQLGRGYVEYLVSHETCHQWWYNLVGNNGYAETFIDEGAATYFTHRMLNRKHGGTNNNFMHWRKELAWLPNIQRENYRYASMYSVIGKDEMPPAAMELPAFGHLHSLFTGAYDRGSKALAMMETRMGEEAFMDFIKDLVSKYSFKVLNAVDYKMELEQYTGKKWDEFYDNWIYGKQTTDWKIISVTTEQAIEESEGKYGSKYYPRRDALSTSIVIQQVAAINEPTVVSIQNSGSSHDKRYGIRIPIDPASNGVQHPTPDTNFNLIQAFGLHDVSVTPGKDNTFTIKYLSAFRPTNVVIDPDNALLDSQPGNNTWKTPPRMYATPFYNTLNETDLTNDYDRWNLGAGPWIGGNIYQDPWYVRSTMIGARAGAYRTQIFNGGLYAAYRTDYRDLVIGADGLFDHSPFSKSQLGFNVERRIGGPYGSEDGTDSATRAAVYGRYVLQYGSSLYLPPMHYVESFATYQDNFLPNARQAGAGSIRPDWTFLGGVHQRLNLNTPYWDPECGVWTDFVYGVGVADLGVRETMHQLRAELALVKKFPDWCILGPLSDARLAVRAVGMAATPDEGQFFALGGGTLFRGFDLAERQGSRLWVANAEVRWPLFRNVEWDMLDSTVGARNVWLATFYDVGAVYNGTQSVNGIAHAVGAGIRVDTAIFSFIERATLRFDVGKTINASTPLQFWFGVQHAY